MAHWATGLRTTSSMWVKPSASWVRVVLPARTASGCLVVMMSTSSW